MSLSKPIIMIIIYNYGLHDKVGNPCPGHDLGQAHRCGGVQWDSNSRSPPSIAGSYNSWIYIHLFSGIKLANGPHLISR